MIPGAGDSWFGHLLTNLATTEPLTLPQYCQLPRCLDWSAGVFASALHRVRAMCLPSGKASPSCEVQGAAMNRTLSSWYFFAIASRAFISDLSLAAVSSYQAIV